MTPLNRHFFTASKLGILLQMRHWYGHGAKIECEGTYIDKDEVHHTVTPLMVAAIHGRVEAVQFLLDKGASIDKTN